MGENKPDTTLAQQALLPREPQRIAHRELNILLQHCAQLDVSDITIQTGMPIFSEIHGRLYPNTRRALTHSEVGSILNTIYGPNGTAQLLTGTDIDTNYELKPDRMTRYRYRVNATACLVEGHQGIQITLRTIPTDPPTIDTMHLPDELLEALTPNDGIIYITGATGSGKSTLLASIIRYIAEDPNCHRKILTYESPIEFVYDAINTSSALISQSEIPLHLSSFAAGVRNALRRKPRLILVGESRDAETISASLEAALTGHPVYTTLHTNGVPETLRRLVGTFPKDERTGRTIDIIETVRLIICQQLVPTLDGKRTPLREYLIFNDEIRDQLLACDTTAVTEITRTLLKKHGQTMQVDAQIKLDAGLISKETYRYFSHT
jgi:defect in organelle trafficking protein DotB